MKKTLIFYLAMNTLLMIGANAQYDHFSVNEIDFEERSTEEVIFIIGEIKRFIRSRLLDEGKATKQRYRQSDDHDFEPREGRLGEVFRIHDPILGESEQDFVDQARSYQRNHPDERLGACVVLFVSDLERAIRQQRQTNPAYRLRVSIENLRRAIDTVEARLTSPDFQVSLVSDQHREEYHRLAEWALNSYIIFQTQSYHRTFALGPSSEDTATVSLNAGTISGFLHWDNVLCKSHRDFRYYFRGHPPLIRSRTSRSMSVLNIY